MSEASAQTVLQQMGMPALAGGIAVCFSHPLELTKVRLQLDNERGLRGEPRMYRGWIDCVRQNFHAHGVRGLQRGLSLGEYTALAFAGAISFEDGVKITKARGEAMQAASEAAKSGMCSVIGLSSDKVDELCKAASEASGEQVQIANYLCNGNYACSGSMAAVEKVMEIAKPEFKARMVVKLAVAGAFHTDFMAPAAEALTAGLADTPIETPKIPVISNVDVEPHADADSIRATLAKQLTSPVQWEKTLTTLLAGGLETSTEVGPGKVIAGIMKRVDKKAVCENFTV